MSGNASTAESLSPVEAGLRIWRGAGRWGWLPGLLLSLGLAWAAFRIEDLAGRWTSIPAPAVFVALLLGLLFAQIGVARRPRFVEGVRFTSTTVLRLGVALLGARISLSQMGQLGVGPFLVVAAVVVITLIAGRAVAKGLKLPMGFAWISAGSVAICGASAALAVAAIFAADKRREHQAALVVALVTVIGTVAMIAYPALAQALGLDERLAGVFLGASLHEVAQAVGAGYMVSEPVGASATLAKLMRVAALAPVIIILSAMLRRDQAEAGDIELPPILPWFLVAFLVTTVVVNAGLIPPAGIALATTASSWALVAAIAALGMKISFGALSQDGPRPVAAILIQTLICGGVALGGVALLAAFGL